MIVALLGLVISLFAYLIAFPRPEQRRFDIYAGLLAMHLTMTIAYWLLSFEQGMDAFTYYRDPYNFMVLDPLDSGTYFIVHVDQTIKRLLGGSFLDHFLFFQCFGMIGFALLVRIMNEVADSLGIAVPGSAYLILFLPGLHFWSSAIGKDAPMFMAVALAAWATLRIHRRIPALGAALLVMALIRPHVAAISVGAVVVALMFSKQLAPKIKLMVTPFVLAGLVFAASRTIERFNLELDPEHLSNFVERQQGLGERFGSGADLDNLSIVGQILSLLFRPFFGIDPMTSMHLAAAAENTVLIGVFLYIAFHWKLLLRLMRNVFFMAYLAVYSATLIVLLSLVNYNIGLGLRQKMMAIPCVILIALTIALYKHYLRTRQPELSAQPEPVSEPKVGAAAPGT